MTFWAVKSLGVNWDELLWKTPLQLLFLWSRQDQYVHNDQVMTLGDKEMIDNLKSKKD